MQIDTKVTGTRRFSMVCVTDILKLKPESDDLTEKIRAFMALVPEQACQENIAVVNGSLLPGQGG